MTNIKQKRNTAKSKVQGACIESWDRFVCRIDDGVYGNENSAFKLIKYLNRKKKDVAQINVINER
jgi:hypothetical protein